MDMQRIISDRIQSRSGAETVCIVYKQELNLSCPEKKAAGQAPKGLSGITFDEYSGYCHEHYDSPMINAE